MAEKPILFNGDMVRAILAGRKTQTRRIVKPQPNHFFDGYNGAMECGTEGKCHLCGDEDGHPYPTPFGEPADVLWVRETWASTEQSGEHAADARIVYAATDPDWQTMKGWRWTPSIHMPRTAARLFLRVKSVRVERLQDITEADALAEGIIQRVHLRMDGTISDPFYIASESLDGSVFNTAREAFHLLWRCTYSEASWEANPWVWRIEFERIENYQAETEAHRE